MKKKLLAVLIIYIVLAGIILWLGSDRLPRDPVARYMVQENAGKIRFLWKSVDTAYDCVSCVFLMNDYDDPELLSDVLRTFKDAVKKYNPNELRYRGLYLCVSDDNPDIISSVIRISNYYMSPDRYDDYQCVEVFGMLPEFPETIYSHAETYLQLKNIKILVVTPEIDKNAKENGIDWYEVWPGLEYYEVREMASVSRIEHPERTALMILSIIAAMAVIIIWLKREKPPKDPVARYMVKKKCRQNPFYGKKGYGHRRGSL